MNKRAGFLAFFVCCAAVASFGYGESEVEDCGQLLVPADRAMLGIEYGQEAQGLRVKSVVPEGPADRAGLSAGDLLVEINGDPLLFRDFVASVKGLNRYRIGQSLRVGVLRNGVTETLELHGERVTCQTAKNLDRLLRAAEAGGLEAACATGEEQAVDDSEYEEGAQILAFMDRLSAAEVSLVLTVADDGKAVSIETDDDFQGQPLTLNALPEFMQELAGRLEARESMTFTVNTQAKTIKVSAVPDDFWPSPAAQE